MRQEARALPGIGRRGGRRRFRWSAGRWGGVGAAPGRGCAGEAPGGDDDEARSGAAEDDEVGAARGAGAGRRRGGTGGRARAGAAGDASAARPARRAGPGRSTTTRGGARGGGTAGDGGGGERRSEFCEVWERRDLWGECSVSAGYRYQPALTRHLWRHLAMLVPAGNSSRH